MQTRARGQHEYICRICLTKTSQAQCNEKKKDLRIFQEEVIYDHRRCSGLGNNVPFVCVRTTLMEKSKNNSFNNTSKALNIFKKKSKSKKESCKIVKETLTLL